MSGAHKSVLPEGFFARAPEIVATELLGRKLVRRLGEDLLEGIIVETEAYYGLTDPASRAFNGLKNYNTLMWKEPGKVFIYNVHRYWMLNIVAHRPNQIGAVLIRAIEPTRGIEIMKRNRHVTSLRDLTSGPGKLTLALLIDKSLNGISVALPGSEIVITPDRLNLEIASSHRIGVQKDLAKKLRFYARANRFVSR